MTFNAQDFMTQAAGTPLDTQLELPQDGGEFLAVADKVNDPEMKLSGPNSKTPGRPFYTLTILWSIQDEAEKARLGRDVVTVRQQMFLDVNEQGQLDFSKQKNISLGQVFQALGMNDGTGSISRIQGGQARVKVRHTLDQRDPSRKFAEVVTVSKA